MVTVVPCTESEHTHTHTHESYGKLAGNGCQFIFSLNLVIIIVSFKYFGQDFEFKESASPCHEMLVEEWLLSSVIGSLMTYKIAVHTTHRIPESEAASTCSPFLTLKSQP